MKNRFSRFWRKIKLLYVLLLPARFSILALAIATFAFTIADQGRDIVRALAEVDPTTGSANWIPLAIFLALMNALAYQIWFAARQMLRIHPEATPDDVYYGVRPDPDSPEFRGWALWIPRILGALLFVAIFYAFYSVRCSYAANVKSVNGAVLTIIAASLLVFVAVVIWRRKWLDRHDQSSIRHVDRSELATSSRRIFFAFLAFELVFFLVATFRPTSLMGFGAGPLVMLTLSLWVPFGSMIVYAGIRARMPILSLLLFVAFVISPIADYNHVIRTIPASKKLVDDRPTVDQQLQRWYDRVSPAYPGDKPIPVFIVATEGGGIRAAYWTATVLDSLHDNVPSFSRNLFAISGVSGGSLGTMVFSALLTEPRPLSIPPAPPSLHYSGARVLGRDFLTPTLASMTQGDFVQRFLPLQFPDRERALEGAWESGYAGEMKTKTFAEGTLALFAKHPELPSIFINGTMVETGDRIITSNCRIRPTAAEKDKSLPLVFRNAFDGFALLGHDLPMSATAGMSARFTYVSPAGRIDGGHVVDGGYFENSGAVTASELVLLINTFSARNPKLKKLQPVVILIDYENCSLKRNECDPDEKSTLRTNCADVFGPFPYQSTEGPIRPPKPERFANEVLSPLRALLATRDARGNQAVGDIRTTFALNADAANRADVIEFRLVQRRVPIPLGWVLSEQARYEMRAAVESQGNQYARHAVATHLGTIEKQDVYALQAKELINKVDVH